MAMVTRSIPELSIDTQKLQETLAASSIGEIVTYDAMTAAIGRDVRGAARGCLRTARARLLREAHRLFGVVTNVGLKRLDDEGKVGASGNHMTRGRNQMRRARTAALSVDNFDAMPNGTKLTHNVLLAQSGAILHMTSARTAKRLAQAIGEGQRTFKPKESLELMKGAL